MSNLMDFLIDNCKVVDETEEIILSERLKDCKFNIKPISGKDFNKIKTDCRTVKKKQIIFDDAAFNEKLIIKCCIEPNFSDVSSIEKAGCKTPGDLINKVLKAGEITDLANAITKLSGFDEDTEEIVEEAKN